VSANNDRLRPTRDKSWDIIDDNRLSEHSAVENVPNGSVGRLPHLLKLKLFDTIFIRGNSSAFDSDFMFEHSVGTVDSHLVISLVSIFNRQIIVIRFQIDVRVDMLFLDPSPNDFGHFVSVNVDYFLIYFDFLE